MVNKKTFENNVNKDIHTGLIVRHTGIYLVKLEVSLDLTEFIQ